MKIAIVGLNSLFASGASSFMLHLGCKVEDWDILLFNKHGHPMENDIPLADIDMRMQYFNDSDAKVLEEYDAILFAAPRWQGKYDFLKNLNLKRVGIVVHDHLDFERMGMSELLGLFPDAVTFCMYSAVEKRLEKPVRIKHPFSSNLLPPMEDSERNIFICASRFSPSKNPEEIAKIVGKYPLHFYGVDGKYFRKSDKFHSKGIVFHFGVYGFREIAVAYSRAIASLDATNLDECYDAVQYTTLEAWNYNTVPMIDKSFLFPEIVSNVACLELTRKNIEKICYDQKLRESIAANGRAMLAAYDSSMVRNDILEHLL